MQLAIHTSDYHLPAFCGGLEDGGKLGSKTHRSELFSLLRVADASMHK